VGKHKANLGRLPEKVSGRLLEGAKEALKKLRPASSPLLVVAPSHHLALSQHPLNWEK